MAELFWNCLIIAFVSFVANGEVFTSVAHLEAVLYAEKDIAITLTKYIQKERERLDKLERLAEDYARHSQKALADPSYYLTNPVSAFLLIKRFTLDWERQVTPILQNKPWQNFNAELQLPKVLLPTFNDLSGAAEALMRLQDTYQLDASKIAHGSLRGVVSPTLSEEECFELGRLSYKEDDFYHSTLWMEEALSQLDQKNRTAAKRVELLDYLAQSYYKQNHFKYALRLTNELLDLDPNHKRASENKRDCEDMLVQQGESPAGVAERPAVRKTLKWDQELEEFSTYEAMCRDEVRQKIQDEHKLKCRYVHNDDPWLLLQPVKMEEKHLNPRIVMFYDMISDREIEEIKSIARPKLIRSEIDNGEEEEVSSIRISKITWLPPEDHPVVARVEQRIQGVTGLNAKAAEDLQVANYGLGGHYEPHHDHFQDEDEVEDVVSGERIATFLIYMSDVEAGGSTVFPLVGVNLRPKRGSAAFWYNLYNNGSGIEATLHAGCPVLVGIKWAANKWFTMEGQEFHRPCALSPLE